MASYRYHAFFLVGATPWIASGLDGVLSRLRCDRPNPATAIPVVASLVACGMLWSFHPPLPATRGSIATGKYPLQAVRLLRERRAQGRALVWFGWIGYALWELSPGISPFIDPRMLDDAPLRPYTHMIWSTPEGRREMDRERIAWVLLPFRSNAGEEYPLHTVLRGDARWRTVFAWDRGALYERRN